MTEYSGAYKMVSGLLDSPMNEKSPYRERIKAAEDGIGENIDAGADAVRHNLILAIKLNIINRKKWSYEFLRLNYGLVICRNKFLEEKKAFAERLARLCGWS